MNIKLYIFVLIIFVLGYKANSQDFNKLYYLDNIMYYNSLMKLNNPASISFFEYKKIGVSHMEFNITDGDYRNYNEPKKINNYIFDTFGYAAKNKLTFYGQAKYKSQRLYDVKYNNVSLLSPDNPFFTSDSIVGDSKNHNYFLKGIKNKWGIETEYIVNEKTDKTDPRPKIVSYKAKIKPGIILTIKNVLFGLHLSYSHLNEDVKFDIINNYDVFNYMRFYGLGRYEKVIDKYISKKYRGNKYELGFQVVDNNGDIKNQSFINIYYNYERAQEGVKRTKYITGDYKKKYIELKHNLLKYSDNNKMQLFSASIKYSNIKGIWFNQEYKYDSNHILYVDVINKSVKYKRNNIFATLKYSRFKSIKGKRLSKISGIAGVKFNKEKALPEKYSLLNNYFELGTDYSYNIKANSFYFSTEIGLNYRNVFNKKLNIKGFDKKNETILPDYLFQTVDIIKMYSIIKCNFNTFRIYNIPPYLKIYYGIDMAINSNNKYREILSLSLGLNF